ncbi:hypothetical protein D3C86_1842530 [compost metagenome]
MRLVRRDLEKPVTFEINLSLRAFEGFGIIQSRPFEKRNRTAVGKSDNFVDASRIGNLQHSPHLAIRNPGDDCGAVGKSFVGKKGND